MARTAGAVAPVGGVAVSLSTVHGSILQHIANLQHLYRTCPADIKATARTWYEDNDRAVVAYGAASVRQLNPNQARAVFARTFTKRRRNTRRPKSSGSACCARIRKTPIVMARTAS